MESRAISLFRPSRAEPSSQGLAQQIPPGRLVEMSGSGPTAAWTAAVALLKQVQAEGETAAWIQFEGGNLFPPDLHESGIDLEALLVVHVPRHRGAYAVPKAAELLLRSGGFGLVILDLSSGSLPRDVSWQGRLLGLIKKHHSRLILLTQKTAEMPSLGPLVSIRIESQRKRTEPGHFLVEHHILKDKSGLLSPTWPERRRGPWGLL